jgi:peptidoglycan/xylan/chitin deacetylase (PgdA/CDA1 family)
MWLVCSLTEKTVTFRIDVDTPTGSLLLNRLHLRSGYLRYLRTLVGLMREFGIRATFMFIPNRTTPSPEILGEVLDTGSEVALHADEVLAAKLTEQKKEMEEAIGRPVSGLSYHGRDLLDFFVHKITRKNRYVAYHNPFSAMLAGFRYDATGYLATRPEFLRTSEKRILLFHSYRDITLGPPILDLKGTLLQHSMNIYMIHPNYLDKYGFRRERRHEIGAIFDHISKSGVRIKTYVEICEEYERMAGS